MVQNQSEGLGETQPDLLSESGCVWFAWSSGPFRGNRVLVTSLSHAMEKQDAEVSEYAALALDKESSAQIKALLCPTSSIVAH